MLHRSPYAHRRQAGMTLLEMVVVLAIVAGMTYLGAMAVGRLGRSRLNEETVTLAGLARRTSQLAVETGQLHRLVLDLDGQTYRIEVCEGGPAAIVKDPEEEDHDLTMEQKRLAIEEARRKLQSVPQNVLPVPQTDDDGEAMALALANQLGARRTCSLASAEAGSFDSKELVRRIADGVKVKQVWVQHLEDPVADGLVAIHFFPVGSAEKAIIEVGNDDESFSVLIHGLTGRIEVRDAAVANPEDFFLRNAVGEKVAEQ